MGIPLRVDVGDLSNFLSREGFLLPSLLQFPLLSLIGLFVDFYPLRSNQDAGDRSREEGRD